MPRYTMSHWGTYEVGAEPSGGPKILPYAEDPDPSPIGLHQLAPELTAVRVRRPAVRASWLAGGPGSAPHLRGREAFVEVEWDVAIDLVARELERVRRGFGNQAIFGGSYGWSSSGRFHHAQSQIHRFLNTIGGYVRHRDSYSLGAAHVIMPHVVAGMNDLISWHHTWDILAEHTQLFVTFGGVPLKNAQTSPGGVGRHRVRDGLQAMDRAGVRFVNVGPVRDNLRTGGDVEWIPCRPNTDAAFMLGLAHALHREGLHDVAFLRSHCVGWDEFERYLTGAADGIPKTPAWASQITGVPVEAITGLAMRMGRSRTMVNVAWSLQRAEHGEQPFWMAVTLAAMLGQIGQPGGGFGAGYGPSNTIGSPHARLGGPTLEQGTNPVRDFIPVARIADLLLNPGHTFTYNGGRYTYPDIKLVYWAGGNPFHHHQDLNRLRRAWERPDTIVVNEQFWTATAKHADIVLPATTSMERDDIGYASQEAMLVAMSKVIEPVGEALDDFEIFRRLASALGVEPAFTEGRTAAQWLSSMYETARERYGQAGIELPDHDTFRRQGIVDLDARQRSVVMLEAFRNDPRGAPLATPSGKLELYSQAVASFDLPDCPGHAAWLPAHEWLGSPLARTFPIHLLSDQPRNKLHSQLDPSPHSAAGKIAGREPVHLHPDDARSRGIRDGDVVELFNERGRCVAAAVVTTDVMPGVARMSTGAWYDPEPGTGRDKHGNPNVLTRDVGASSLSQGCAAQSCLVEIRGPVTDPPPVTAFELPAFTSGPSSTSLSPQETQS
jgi:biotin/methionine sulfoxide reductase